MLQIRNAISTYILSYSIIDFRCEQCEAFQNLSENEKALQQEKQNLHLSNKKERRAHMELDKQRSIQDTSVCSINLALI